MRPLSLTVLLMWCTVLLFAQNPLAPTGGGAHTFAQLQSITDAERQEVNRIIDSNIKTYDINLIKAKSSSVLFDWPLMQNQKYDWNSTYAIRSFVDHNLDYPDLLTDYNCGQQSYDTPTGYNHQGTDIFLWPFPQKQYERNQTYVTAAASGIILAKNDGQIDNNCSANNNPANYIIIEHNNGSRTWYWHLKNGSVNAKQVGQSVSRGEILGVVASSGNSTGPHLHFECYDQNLHLIDPFAGACNNMNSISYWQSQRSYWEPTVNVLFTHSAPPQFNTCPNTEQANIKTRFDEGATVYFGAYLQDQSSISTVEYRVIQPNGTIWNTWTHNPNLDQRSSYWYWNYSLPSDAMNGTWTWEATLNNETTSRTFWVGDCPNSYTNDDILYGLQPSSEDFEAEGIIQSTQFIYGNGTQVSYDSGTSIELQAGFEVLKGSTFEAFIDGCGGI